ncbi:MAG: hypothetical protein JXR33_05895 [Coriobacteriia bacterium]|nr:hypothetical protein [Coriobacteriia bacterium]
MVSRSVARKHQIVFVSASVAVLALSALLLFDSVFGDAADAFPQPMRATSIAEVAGAGSRARMINPVIASAVRDAAGDGALLEIPEGYQELLAVEPDVFGGKPQPTLDAALISPFLGGRVQVTSYDPVLSAAATRIVQSDPELIVLPRDVSALPVEDDDAVLRVYTDPTRIYVYIMTPQKADEVAR